MSVAVMDVTGRCASCGQQLRRAAPEPEPRYLVAGPMTLDLERWTVTVGGQVIAFAHEPVWAARREWGVLVTLARQAGRLVTHADLARDVYAWPNDRATRHALAVEAYGLRRRLGEHGALIVTHRGRGLRLDVGGTP